MIDDAGLSQPVIDVRDGVENKLSAWLKSAL